MLGKFTFHILNSWVITIQVRTVQDTTAMLITLMRMKYLKL